MAAAILPFLKPGAVLAQSSAETSSDEALLAMVHPDLRANAARMLQFTRNDPPFSRETLVVMREKVKRYEQPLIANVSCEMRVIPGRAGQPDVRIYVINAKAGTKAGNSRPAILHMHGGGFIAGTAAVEIPSMQALCKQLDCVAVTVDYRLAPETTYAGSIEDNYSGLKWLHDNAASLGVDPARIAVMGGSAGGGHAALLAITARDRGEVPLVFQCLTYPMLDDRTGSTRKPPPHVGKLIWTAQDNRFGWESFLGTRTGARTAPRGAVPARVENLAGLPPAFIGVGSLDLFADEDVEYARRLNAAGVPTELIVVPGAFHGFDGMPDGAPISRWFGEARLDALRRALAPARG